MSFQHEPWQAEITVLKAHPWRRFWAWRGQVARHTSGVLVSYLRGRINGPLLDVSSVLLPIRSTHCSASATRYLPPRLPVLYNWSVLTTSSATYTLLSMDVQ